jgi:radical SAM superfamily enzyme YgiQ (UPF0313 family)
VSRNIVLVSLDYLRPKDPRRSLGHASLLARLRTEPRSKALPLEFAVNESGFRREHALVAILESILDRDTIVAIGVYVWNERVVQWLLPALRQAGFSGRIVLGGPQISYAPTGIDATYPDADVFVRGYGEDALVRLVAGDDSIPGVTRRGHDDSASPTVIDLASLPSPYLSRVLPPHPFVRWETQRGCDFACSFCQHRESGTRLRQRKIAEARIDDEIDFFVEHGVRDIAVLDPVFNRDRAHAIRILSRFAERGFTGRLSLQCRFEFIDDEFLDACEQLKVRLEFGLQTIHRAEMQAVRRTNDILKAEQVIQELHARRIQFEVSLIYGLPEQTLASFRASVAWCQAHGIPVVHAFPLMLLRGTGLDRDRSHWQLEERSDPIPVVVASNTFNRAEWEAMRQIAEKLEASTAAPVRGSAPSGYPNLGRANPSPHRFPPDGSASSTFTPPAPRRPRFA